MAEVALVTGSTSGLGFALAVALADAGYDVAVHGRSKSGADDAAARVQESARCEGTRVAGFAVDLAQDGAPCRLVDAVTEALGPPAVLVNNAADQALTPPDADSTQAWRHAMDVNVLAAVELSRLACVPGRAGVRIVNIASIEGATPLPSHGAYAASKAALLSFTRSAAVELAPARVNAVAPGLIGREGLAEQWPQGHDWWSRTAPLGRPVTAAEVAAAVVFLASPQASGVTGVTLVVDGGWSASARM